MSKSIQKQNKTLAFSVTYNFAEGVQSLGKNFATRQSPPPPRPLPPADHTRPLTPSCDNR